MILKVIIIIILKGNITRLRNPEWLQEVYLLVFMTQFWPLDQVSYYSLPLIHYVYQGLNKLQLQVNDKCRTPPGYQWTSVRIWCLSLCPLA